MILQKIKTGSSLYLKNPQDKDYLIFYNSDDFTREQMKSLRAEGEDYFLIDINLKYAKDKDVFFVLMTYIIHSELKLEYEVYAGEDYFKKIFDENIDDLDEITQKAKAMYLHPDTNKINWWFKGAENFLETGETGLSEEFILASRPKQNKSWEIQNILKWFNDTDYIELQAVRGTISRDSEKYQNYLAQYNDKLARYQILKDELA